MKWKQSPELSRLNRKGVWVFVVRWWVQSIVGVVVSFPEFSIGHRQFNRRTNLKEHCNWRLRASRFGVWLVFVVDRWDEETLITRAVSTEHTFQETSKNNMTKNGLDWRKGFVQRSLSNHLGFETIPLKMWRYLKSFESTEWLQRTDRSN